MYATANARATASISPEELLADGGCSGSPTRSSPCALRAFTGRSGRAVTLCAVVWVVCAAGTGGRGPGARAGGRMPSLAVRRPAVRPARVGASANAATSTPASSSGTASVTPRLATIGAQSSTRRAAAVMRSCRRSDTTTNRRESPCASSSGTCIRSSAVAAVAVASATAAPLACSSSTSACASVSRRSDALA